MNKHRILFLAANPAGLTERRLDEEARQIQEEIRRAKERDRFEFVARLAARPLDLLRALREIRPSIVHFSGHTGADGIYLVVENGQPAQITRDALHETFGAAGLSVQIVVLNGCAMEDLGKAVCRIVPVCVGTSASTDDGAARAFSVGFYGAIAWGESAARACLHGGAAMHLVTGSQERPCLYQRVDIEPEAFVLADDLLRPEPRSRASGLAAVVERYRTRKSGSFERWDLRTATPTTGNRPAEITLDEMYIPLRFAPQLDPDELDRGAPIHPDDLLAPRRPQVVIGNAGTGKTTWMRWMFRRLLQDPRALPFFLELRAIAAAWKTPQDAARPIESYLADALSEGGASDPNAIVRALLADASGPRPVILIDGWDELGQGERLRERLVEFCRAFSHVVVVVSSRPYGETRPAGAEAFETLYIQPLSDDDVRCLATRFHRSVHGHDESAAARATDELMAALAAAPHARSLAGTALLLTMMLLLSREGPLPDRRHKLYTACLRNMLLHRVTLRERDGVVIDLDQQWRPEDREERLRAVAELAYRMQIERYYFFHTHRTPHVRSWDDALGLLGGDWTRDQRERFLRWLVASAGVLIDRTDGSVQFAHLSFQEHLAAYHLFITREGDDCVAAIRSHADDRGWWETLRLWAAVLVEHRPDELGPVLDVLRSDANAYWLAGQMLADGTGGSSDFEAWVNELPARLSDPFTRSDESAAAWATCKQEDRRGRIAAVLASVRGSLHWLEGTWHLSWCSLARLEVEPAPALLALAAPLDSAAAAARSRVLHGAAARWPDGGELAVLRLWPSVRAAVGVRLQSAISLGARMPEVVAILPSHLERARRIWSVEETALAKDLTRALYKFYNRGGIAHLGGWFFRRYHDWGLDLGEDFVRDFARDFARDFVRYFDQGFDEDLGEKFGRDFVLFDDATRYFGSGFERELVRKFGFYLGREFSLDYIVHYWPEGQALPYVRRFAQRLIRDLGLSGIAPTAPWMPTLALFEASSVSGRASLRAALAHQTAPGGPPLLALMRVASRASFAPGDPRLRDATARACDAFDGDPIWPALARHVARISTPDDRALLVHLARHPETCAPPLSWGLQHHVRGDLVFDDGSVVTLDELCARAGLDPPPLLELMSEELDVQFDDTTIHHRSRCEILCYLDRGNGRGYHVVL